jgi:rubrerythrin
MTFLKTAVECGHHNPEHTRHGKETTMATLGGTRTEQNLKAAFTGEAEARARYTAFASVARKEGFEQIAAIFMETAEQEKEHGKLHLKALNGIGDTLANLRTAAANETHEWTDMYPGMARTAREEGFPDLAFVFETLATVEKEHAQRYARLVANMEAGQVFKKPAVVRWRCRECGFTHEGTEAVPKCPLCQHPQAFFEMVKDNF